jgi:hypothetical protein
MPMARPITKTQMACAPRSGSCSACTDHACRGSATLALREGWSEIDGAGQSETSVTGASVIPIGRPLLFLHAEVELCNQSGDCYGVAANANGGVRFAGARWACDLGWSKVLADKHLDIRIADWTPAGSPWFSVTYRRP